MAPSRSYPVGKYANATEALKKKIQHPIIDGDGHTIEFMPHVVECMREIAGKDLANQLEVGPCYDGMSLILSVNQESKKNLGLIRPPWWAVPAENTLDRATATFPKLLYERLDEIGLDFQCCTLPMVCLFLPLKMMSLDNRLVARSIFIILLCTANIPIA